MASSLLRKGIEAAIKFFDSAIDVIKLLRAELEENAKQAKLRQPWEFKEILTLDEAAEFLRIPIETLSEELANGRLPGKQLGSEWRFEKYALKNALDQRFDFASRKSL